MTYQTQVLVGYKSLYQALCPHEIHPILLTWVIPSLSLSSSQLHALEDARRSGVVEACDLIGCPAAGECDRSRCPRCQARAAHEPCRAPRQAPIARRWFQWRRLAAAEYKSTVDAPPFRNFRIRSVVGCQLWNRWYCATDDRHCVAVFVRARNMYEYQRILQPTRSSENEQRISTDCRKVCN